MLLLWLSIVCMIPFDMARFDGLHKEEAVGVVERRRPVVERILETAKVGKFVHGLQNSEHNMVGWCPLRGKLLNTSRSVRVS